MGSLSIIEKKKSDFVHCWTCGNLHGGEDKICVLCKMEEMAYNMKRRKS